VKLLVILSLSLAAGVISFASLNQSQSIVLSAEQCLLDTSIAQWGPCAAVNGGATSSETVVRGGGRPTYVAVRATI